MGFAFQVEAIIFHIWFFRWWDSPHHLEWWGSAPAQKKNIGPHGGSMAVQMRPNNKHRFKAGIVF